MAGVGDGLFWMKRLERLAFITSILHAIQIFAKEKAVCILILTVMLAVYNPLHRKRFLYVSADDKI